MSKIFDHQAPLISLHVPKCGGQSLVAALSACTQSGYVLIPFFPEIGHTLPARWNAARTIVHGHFVRWKGHRVEDMCAGASQYTTVVREPFDALISGYAYGLQTGQDWAVNQSADAFLDWWLESGNQPLLGALPAIEGARTIEEYASRFVLLGVLERLDDYVGALADLLQVEMAAPPVRNTSTRAGFDIPDRRAEFRRAMPLDFELYDYVARQYGLRPNSVLSVASALELLEAERHTTRVLRSRLDAAQTVSDDNRKWAERVERTLATERAKSKELAARVERAQRLSDDNRGWAERAEQMLETERASSKKLAARLEGAQRLSDDNRAWAQRTEGWLESERCTVRDLKSEVASQERELAMLRAFASRFRWLHALFRAFFARDR